MFSNDTGSFPASVLTRMFTVYNRDGSSCSTMDIGLKGVYGEAGHVEAQASEIQFWNCSSTWDVLWSHLRNV